MRKIAPRSGDEIVETDHLMAIGQQTVAQMRADESGGPGNEMIAKFTLNTF